MENRATWAALSDEQLLSRCEIDTYRASGPGGQKRNKTSSAVRLRHEPSGLIVIAEESRSQHENKAKALKRLRQAFFLKLREPLTDAERAELAQRPEITACLAKSGRLDVSKKEPRFWVLVGLALDVLDLVQAQVSTAAEHFGVSTGNFLEILQMEPKVWAKANQLRQKFHQKPLRMSD